MLVFIEAQLAPADILQPICVLILSHTKMIINVLIKIMLYLQLLHHEHEVQNWSLIEVIRAIGVQPVNLYAIVELLNICIRYFCTTFFKAIN